MSWLDVCAVDELLPEAGVCALVAGQQVAIVSYHDTIYAVANFDPFSKAFVISRGIVGDRGGVPMIASPIYKNAFDLRNGKSLDDPSVQLATWPIRVQDGRVQIYA